MKVPAHFGPRGGAAKEGRLDESALKRQYLEYMTESIYF